MPPLPIQTAKVEIKGKSHLRVEEPAPVTQKRTKPFHYRVNLPYQTPEERYAANEFRKTLWESLEP